MRIIVSQSLGSSHPLDQDPTKAVGINIPIVRGSRGYFETNYTTADAIKNDLINLLLTQQGERPLNPTFGTKLNALLFEQNTADLALVVRNSITSAINRWMPFVKIQNVIVRREPEDVDIYTMKVSIYYYVPNIVSLTEVALLLEL
jgi:phage baseplate assembly protein W